MRKGKKLFETNLLPNFALLVVISTQFVGKHIFYLYEKLARQISILVFKNRPAITCSVTEYNDEQ